MTKVVALRLYEVCLLFRCYLRQSLLYMLKSRSAPSNSFINTIRECRPVFIENHLPESIHLIDLKPTLLPSISALAVES